MLAPVPGTDPASATETFRQTSAQRASSCAPICPMRRRISGSSQAPVLLAISRKPLTSSIDWKNSETNAVPRSNPRVTIVTRQPSFSSPTRFSTGIRTSSKKSSANSVEPAIVRSGRTSIPGDSISMTEPGDPAVTTSFGSGADQQLAVVGDLGVRCPDLLSGHHVLVAVSHRPRPERRQIASGVRLRKTLAPDRFSGEDRSQIPLALRLGSLDRDRRSGVQETDEVHPDVRGVRPLQLLYVYELLDR